ncbi:ankyrin repeat domain-containing protein [Rhodococcus qingshengii]|nr:ankyrin repeat domain-containing protein [Rhodococcus sp. (in: high G+C Gram-positive bacteria)]QTS00119.1 ankyrin repeat domain-containing protein [Rhodococcus qingshengii]
MTALPGRSVFVCVILAVSVTGALAGCSSSDTPVTSTIAASATTTAAVSITGVKPPSTPESERALFDAVDRNDPAAITAALASGANIEARGEGERTPLVEATKNNAVAAASTLILAGADVNAKDSMQDSAFLYSGAEGLNEILALTLAHGADVDSVNRYGGTALIPASEHAHVETVRMLIAAGVPVNHINDPGWTALLEAVVYGDGSARYIDVITHLLDAGADPSIRDASGKTALDNAESRGQSDVVALLQSRS